MDQTSVLATHLAELIKQHAHELLSRQETKRLVDRLSESHPKLLEELVPKLMSLGEVQKVLQQLLREQVSIRDLGTILETLVEIAPARSIPWCWWKPSRQALGRALVRPLLNEEGSLKVVTVDATLEEELARSFQPQMPSSAAPAAVVRAPRAGLPETHAGRAGHDGDAGAALRIAGALSSPSFAGTISTQSRGAVAG